MGSVSSNRRANRKANRRRFVQRSRNIILQLADIDPFAVENRCFFCGAEDHRDRCLWLEARDWVTRQSSGEH